MTTNEKPDLRDRTLTFQMLWDTDRCMRRLLWGMLRHRRITTPGDRLAQRVGKGFEIARAAETPDEVEEAVEATVARFAPEEQPAVRERLVELLERADVIDEEIAEEEPECDNVVAEKQTQFYAPLPGDWRMAAKPDGVNYLTNTPEYGDVVQVVEEKTKGYYSSFLREQLYFFGLVISVALQREFDAEEAKAWAKYREDTAVWERQRYQNGHRVPRPRKPRSSRRRAIQLVPLLAGKVRNEAGELVPAPQPSPFMYSRWREPQKLAEAVAATQKIEKAFADNDFPAESGTHCHGCPFRFDCDKFAPALEAVPTEAALPGVISLPVIASVAS
ncbi:MAG TPA: hypothetical protein V6C69_22800 [Trichormus sp.]